jgi:L-amino acid N-acyltransferase YncA
MITIQVENVAQCWDEIYPLTELHWTGTKTYRRHEPFNPDKARYLQYNDMGYFHLITVRDAGRLVGYFGLYVTTSMHSQLRMATEDTFFIHPDYRHGRLALRVLKYVQSYCALLGVHELLFSCETDNTTGIVGLLEHLGFQEKIRQFSLILDPPPSADSAQPDAVGVYESPPQLTA